MIDTTRVLAVDDEPQITRVLRTVLMSRGYEVRTTPDGESALSIFSEWRPHLVLSIKTAEHAKVEALDSGADDYVTKPFGADELLARVRAALRRASDDTAEVTPLEIGDFRIDLSARRVYVRGHQVRLTPKEFDLFLYLARRPNRVIEHDQLLQAVWGEMSRDHPEYLRVFVGQLRKKLEADPSRPRYLATEPWVGYRLVVPPEPR